jgi:threonine/homoserine/homoserine lactone efflux protein
MADWRIPFLVAALVGFVCALFFSSIPVGPINLTILNEGARAVSNGRFFIGLGASVMDVIYCSISFTGISQFIDHGIVQT